MYMIIIDYNNLSYICIHMCKGDKPENKHMMRSAKNMVQPTKGGETTDTEEKGTNQTLGWMYTYIYIYMTITIVIDFYCYLSIIVNITVYIYIIYICMYIYISYYIIL